jgi:SAM-dependent methyltransferase
VHVSSTWPGKALREPRRGNSAYLIAREITRSLAAARDRYLQPGTRVLDVGCGVQPYYPLFADVAAAYDGNDLEAGPRITFVSPAEELEAQDQSYDLVLCTQVLHLVRRPQRALEEFARVLAPGGHVFLTTHGVYPFHPNPADYWRWTQQGLPALFDDVAGLELVQLEHHGGSGTALAVMINTPIRQIGRGVGAEWIGAPIIAAVNALGAGIDRVLPARARDAMIPNFLAVARRV